MMIKNKRENVVYPAESTWFGELLADESVIPMEDTRIYKEDLFGLKTLDKEGRVAKVEFQGWHLISTPNELREVMVPALLK